MAKTAKLVKGRLGRLRQFAGAGLRMGADVALGREGIGAEKAAEILGNLRGVATKVGQMAGYVDGVIPDDQREVYETWMQRLLDQAPTSDPEQVRQQILDQLGRPLEQAFAEFDAVPVASASIGQVHRAALPDGRAVAVKVQHPGIDEAMRHELANSNMVEQAFRLFAGSKFESKRIAAEIRARFAEELDYELEARRQTAIRALHLEDPAIQVPAVIDSHSAAKVLTMEWAEGMNFAEAVAAPEELRRQWAEAMWRFAYKSVLIGGQFNADPHPGNYKFHADGRVTFLDHGCVQEAGHHSRSEGIATHRAACVGDIPAFEDAARRMLDLRGGSFERAAFEYLHEAFAPQLRSPYRIERAYVAGLARRFKDIFQVARTSQDDSYVPFAEGVFFLNRLQFGFYSVLARLDVEVDYARVELAFLDGAPPIGCPPHPTADAKPPSIS